MSEQNGTIMLHFFIGTKAQFIKMAPIMVALRKRNIPYRYIDTGQHAATTAILRKDFALPPPDLFLCKNDSDITKISSGIYWYLGLLVKSLISPEWLHKKVFPGGGICLIHGDTLSTLLGLQLAKRAKLRVAHVEAGLRSYNIFDPFPEELIRIICMKRSDQLFCPSPEGEDNLKRMNVRGKIYPIPGNTVIDAINIFYQRKNPLPEHQQPYCIATCHRLETITSKQRLERVIDLLNKTAKYIRIIFVAHKPTLSRLQKYGLTQRISSNIHVLNSMEYAEFLPLLRDATLVMTDGGSIQEECAYLGKPCVLLRKTTERPDGLGKNAILWKYDDQVVLDFIADLPTTPALQKKTPASPSKEIIKILLEA